MIGAERALRDAERAAQQGLGPRVAARGLVGAGQEPEAQGHARVLGAAGALRALERGSELALRLDVAALLVGAVARRHRRLPARAVGGGLRGGAGGGEQQDERRAGAGSPEASHGQFRLPALVSGRAPSSSPFSIGCWLPPTARDFRLTSWVRYS